MEPKSSFSSGTYFFKISFKPFLRAMSPGPNHLLEPPPLNTVIMAIKFP
jgi:hypothetical protein